jgi:predicted 3-demethylubiquinone-9 3-methyltransferase (glyoxalase superfamily)
MPDCSGGNLRPDPGAIKAGFLAGPIAPLDHAAGLTHFHDLAGRPVGIEVGRASLGGDKRSRKESTMPKIAPCLWFDRDAEAAARFYCEIFPNSKVCEIARYPEGLPGDRAGEVMTVAFELDGVPFLGLNGGPHFKFSEAVSFLIEVKDQAELDRYWTALLAGGGAESQCGWLKDRFGLSWQVTPVQLPHLMANPDREKAARVAAAMLTMKKLDIAALEAAARP